MDEDDDGAGDRDQADHDVGETHGDARAFGADVIELPLVRSRRCDLIREDEVTADQEGRDAEDEDPRDVEDQAEAGVAKAIDEAKDRRVDREGEDAKLLEEEAARDQIRVGIDGLLGQDGIFNPLPRLLGEIMGDLIVKDRDDEDAHKGESHRVDEPNEEGLLGPFDFASP